MSNLIVYDMIKDITNDPHNYQINGLAYLLKNNMEIDINAKCFDNYYNGKITDLIKLYINPKYINENTIKELLGHMDFVKRVFAEMKKIGEKRPVSHQEEPDYDYDIETLYIAMLCPNVHDYNMENCKKLSKFLFKCNHSIEDAFNMLRSNYTEDIFWEIIRQKLENKVTRNGIHSTFPALMKDYVTIKELKCGNIKALDNYYKGDEYPVITILTGTDPTYGIELAGKMTTPIYERKKID